MFLTEEMMDEIAAWQSDSLWSAPEADSDTIRESDVAPDCVHDGSTITEYANKAGTYFAVWECGNCGNVGQLGKEN